MMSPTRSIQSSLLRGVVLAGVLCALPPEALAGGNAGAPALLEKSPQYRGLARRYDIVAVAEADVDGDALREYVVAFGPSRPNRRRGGFAVISFRGGKFQLAWAGLYPRSRPETLSVLAGEIRSRVMTPDGLTEVALVHGKDFWLNTEKQSPFNCMTVRVSNESRPISRSRMVPANLFDGDPDTVWRTTSTGTGVGEWVQIDFKQPVDVGLVGVIGGDHRSPKQWRDSNRLFRFDLLAETEADRSTTVENLDISALLKLPSLPSRVTVVAKDSRRSKWAEIARRQVVSLKLEASSVYLGEENNSLYLSEIELGQLLADPVPELPQAARPSQGAPSADLLQ